jgi:hypothetical protein
MFDLSLRSYGNNESTCKRVAERPLPLRVQQAVHFGRVYLLKVGQRCEHSCETALSNHGNINVNIFSHYKGRERERERGRKCNKRVDENESHGRSER